MSKYPLYATYGLNLQRSVCTLSNCFDVLLLLVVSSEVISVYSKVGGGQYIICLYFNCQCSSTDMVCTMQQSVPPGGGLTLFGVVF